MSYSADQNEMRLDGDKTRDTDKTWSFGGYLKGCLKKALVHPTMHHLNLGPLVGRGPPHELTLAECAHADCERSLFQFDIEREQRGFFEFLRAMRGEAVGDTRQLRCKHRDSGRVGAEMSVQVLNVVVAAPSAQKCCLHDIGKMSHDASVRPPTHFCRNVKQANDRERLFHKS